MNEILNTRDIAIAIWVAVILVLCAVLFTTRTEFRRSLVALLRVALSRQLLVTFLFICIYVAVVVIALHSVGLWSPALVKNTAIWLLFSGIPLAFAGVVSGNTTEIRRRVIRNLLRAVVVVEYVITTYTFAFFVEFLLVPLVVLVAMMDVVARSDGKTKTVARITGVLQPLIGVLIVASASWVAYTNLGSFDPTKAMQKILLVPLLSIALVPVAHLLAVYAAYDSLFVYLRFGPTKDLEIAGYARRRLLAYLGLHPEKVHDFTRRRGFALSRVTTSVDLDRLLEEEGATRSESPIS